MLRTPLRRSPWLSDRGGGDVRLKIETLQPTFSYKIRGAFNAVLRLVAEHGGPNVPPIVTASAGNHGRALAWAAQAAGLTLKVYVPRDAPRSKLEAIRAAGAELEHCASYDEAERRAKAHAANGSAVFISAYSHPDVIAGAGTVGLEILEQWPEVEVIVVPIGGGGLISGVAIAASESSTVDVIGVEVLASSPFTQSLAAGHIVAIDVGPTLADGLAGNLDPETLTFDIVRERVAQIALVSEEELRAAMSGAVANERLIVEGAGAAALAAIHSGRVEISDRRVAVVVSGANIDREKLIGIV